MSTFFLAWFVLLIVGLDLFSRRINGLDEMAKLYLLFKQCPLPVIAVHTLSFAVLIPFTIPYSLYLIFKNKKDGNKGANKNNAHHQ